MTLESGNSQVLLDGSPDNSECFVSIFGLNDQLDEFKGLSAEEKEGRHIFSAQEVKWKPNVVEERNCSFDDLMEICVQTHWSAAKFTGRKRKGENVEMVTCLAYDVDEDDTLADAIPRLGSLGLRCFIATSKNHQRAKETATGIKAPCDRFRVVIKTTRPMLPKEFLPIWQAMKLKITPTVDESAKDPSRFWNACREVVADFEGAALDIDRVLAEIPVKGLATPQRSKGAPKLVSVPKQIDSVGGFAQPEIPSGLWTATTKFLTTGAENGKWNKALFDAARDLRDHGLSIEEATKILTSASQLPGNLGCLQPDDLLSIKSAYSREGSALTLKEKIERYAAGQSGKPASREAIYSKGALLTNFKDEIFEVLADNFVIFRNRDGIQVPYNVVRKAEKEVSVLREPAEMRRLLLREIGPYLGRATADEIVEQFRAEGDGLIYEEPLQFAFEGDCDGKYTMTRLPRPKEGPYPAWHEFLARLSDPDAYMGFIWSIFERKHSGRQICTLIGDGNDGKSKTFEALESLLKCGMWPMGDTSLKNEKFFYSGIAPCRLVCYADCKNDKILLSEIMKNISGNDVVEVNAKNAQMTSQRMYKRVLIGTNEKKMQLTAQRCDTSRALLEKVAPSKENTPGWGQALKDEILHFLYACKGVYARVCPDNYRIQLNEASEALIREACGNTTDEFDDFIDDHFVITDSEEDRVSSSRFWSIVRFHRGWAQNSYKAKDLVSRLDQRGSAACRTSKSRFFKNLRVRADVSKGEGDEPIEDVKTSLCGSRDYLAGDYEDVI